jgi:hypothetical protein
MERHARCYQTESGYARPEDWRDDLTARGIIRPQQRTQVLAWWVLENEPWTPMPTVEYRKHHPRVLSTKPSLQLRHFRSPIAAYATETVAPLRPWVSWEPALSKIQLSKWLETVWATIILATSEGPISNLSSSAQSYDSVQRSRTLRA